MKNDKKAIEQLDYIGKPFKGIDLSAIAGFNTATLGMARTIAEMQDSMIKPFKEIDFSAIAGFNTATLGMARTIAEMQNSMIKPFEGINFSAIAGFNTATLGMAGVIAEMLNNMIKPLKGIDFSAITGLNAATLGMVGAIAEMQNNLIKPFEGIDFSAIAGVNTASLRIVETMVGLQNSLKEQFENIDLKNIKVNENGTINYLDETVEFKDTVDEIKLCINSEINWEEKIVKILQSIKLKHPVIVFIIISFILYPFYSYYVDCTKAIIIAKVQEVQDKNKISADKNKIIKDMRNEVSLQLNANSSESVKLKAYLNQYRFVKAERLNVRISNSTNTKVLATLEFGQVVRVLDKNKEWVLIEYNDNRNIYIKGWVFSKYISKFY